VWQSITVNNNLDPVQNWMSVDQAAQALNVPKGRVNRLLEEYSLVAVKKDGQLPLQSLLEGKKAPVRRLAQMLDI
jgi:excisionase family DNA binding protein